jgi:hypothetical protein
MNYPSKATQTSLMDRVFKFPDNAIRWIVATEGDNEEVLTLFWLSENGWNYDGKTSSNTWDWSQIEEVSHLYVVRDPVRTMALVLGDPKYVLPNLVHGWISLKGSKFFSMPARNLDGNTIIVTEVQNTPKPRSKWDDLRYVGLVRIPASPKDDQIYPSTVDIKSYRFQEKN